MANPHPHLKDIKKLRYIDALRGIAILGVVLVHCSFLSGQKDSPLALIGFAGQRGVQLFFVISAFTIFYSLHERTKEERYPILNFFVRRFFRIAPLFYFAILLNLSYQGLQPRKEAPNGMTWIDVVLGFFFLNGFKPSIINAVAIGGWSIAVETTFYALVPLLQKYIKSLRAALKLTLVSGVCIYCVTTLLSHYVDSTYSEYLLFLSFPTEFPIFCMGLLTYFLWKERIINDPHVEANKDKKKWSLILILIALNILALNFPFSNNNLHSSSLAFIPLTLGLSLYPWPLFVNRITVFLGKISYSIYLMHFFVIIGVEVFLNKVVPKQFALLKATPILFLYTFLAVLVCSAVVCTITYYLIEKPGINLGKALVRFIESQKTQKLAQFESKGGMASSSEESAAPVSR